MNKIIVIEGICCSGKTTICNLIMSRLKAKNIKCVYNHGALSYSKFGNELYNHNSSYSTIPITMFYYLDLIHNTQNIISEYLNKSYIVLQDRYFNSVATYANAYGKYSQTNLNFYWINKLLKENNLLLVPDIEIFCIPPLDVITTRMANSKSSRIHDFYRDNELFLKLVYEEIKDCASNSGNAITIDTSSNQEISLKIEEVIQKCLVSDM